MGSNENKPQSSFDPVEEASQESFPASDPPAWTMGAGAGFTRSEVLSIEVVNNEAESRFETSAGGKLAVLDYKRAAQEIVFTHAEVPPELEGRGLGSKIVRAGLEFAREHGLKVVPLCPFVAWYIQQHREHADLLRPDYRARLAKRA